MISFIILAKKFLDTDGNVMKLRHEIQCILPSGWSQSDCLELQTEAKDWIPFENSKFDLETPYKAPLMKNMPVNYRLKLKPNPETTETALKVVKKRLVKRPLKRKITSKSSEVVVLSDTEVKAKKLKQQKLMQMKKVILIVL